MKVGKGSLRVRRRLFFGAAAVFGLAIIVTTLHFISLNNIALAGLDERYIDVDKYAALNIDYYDPCWGGGSRSGNDDSKSCENVSGSDVTWVGDSYTVSASTLHGELIEKALPGVDIHAQYSKNIGTPHSNSCDGGIGDNFSDSTNCNQDGLTIVQKLKDSGKLRKYLVFALGTNDPDTSAAEKIKSLAEKAGDGVKIVVTTAYTNTSTNYSGANKAIKDFADSNSNVALADWAAVAKNDYYQTNETHPEDGDGYKEWTNTIVTALKSLGGNCGGTLKGDNNYEKVWNAIASAGLDGISGNTEIMAGILGNFALENGRTNNNDLNPVHNYGLWGENCGTGNCGVRRNGMNVGIVIDKAVEKNPEIEKWITSESNANIDSVPADIIDDTIKYEVEYMKTKDTVLEFMEDIKSITSSGEEAVAEAAKKWEENIEKSGGSGMDMRQGFAKNIYKMVTENGKIDIDEIYKIGATDDQKVAVDDNLVATEPLTAGSIDGGASSSNWKEAKDYAGNKIFDDEQISKIEKNAPLYKEVGDAKGIPWAFLAAIHYREGSLDRETGGEYGFGFSDNSCMGGGDGESDEGFKKVLECASDYLLEKRDMMGADLSTDDGIKATAFAYNGVASAYVDQGLDLGFSPEQAKNGEGSPYVMNMYDEKRDSRKSPSNWCQYGMGGELVCPTNSVQYGAFVIYKALGGASIDSSGSSSGSNGGNVCCPPGSGGGGGGGTSEASGEVGTLQELVKSYVWKVSEQNGGWNSDGTQWNGRKDAKPAYEKDKLSGDITDCGVFVKTVMTKSGWDTNFKDLGATDAIMNYLSNSNEWEEVTDQVKSGEKDKWQAGDVAVRDGHTFLYAGDLGDDYADGIVEASLYDHAPLASTYTSFDAVKKNSAYHVFRKKSVAVGTTAVAETTEKTTLTAQATDSSVAGVTITEINGKKYAFPLAGASKENYLNPGGSAGESVLSNLPCGSESGCHHDYMAVDMGLRMSKAGGTDKKGSDYGLSGFDDYYYYSAGAPVVAVTSGTISSYTNYTNGVDSNWHDKCAQISFSGDDGYNYWLGHMEYNSDLVSKLNGKHVEAGELIGYVGAPTCAQNTQSHLHIDSYKNSWGSNNSDPGRPWIIELMNKLYEALPGTNSTSSTSVNDPCGGGDGGGGSGGNVDENGMNEEDAKKLVQNYGQYHDSDTVKYLSMCGDPTKDGENANGCRACNCSCFSEFFIHKFVSGVSGSFDTDGSSIVSSFESNGTFETGTEPRVWAVFQRSDQHTGIILGKENGKWIVGQAAWPTGSPTAGDGYSSSNGGAAWIAVSENIEEAAWLSGTIKFAYLNSNGHKVDIDAINNYVKNGP